MNGRRTTLATISTATNWICASTSLMTMNEKKLTELRTFGSAAAAGGERGAEGATWKVRQIYVNTCLNQAARTPFFSSPTTDRLHIIRCRLVLPASARQAGRYRCSTPSPFGVVLPWLMNLQQSLAALSAHLCTIWWIPPWPSRYLHAE